MGVSESLVCSFVRGGASLKLTIKPAMIYLIYFSLTLKPPPNRTGPMYRVDEASGCDGGVWAGNDGVDKLDVREESPSVKWAVVDRRDCTAATTSL